MRRWHLLNRLLREPARPDSDRCFLVVEELEAREVLSPVVFAPNFFTPKPPEDTAFTFGGSSAFSASDVSDSGQLYQANLTAAHGIITVTPMAGVSVTNNGGPTVTLVGQLPRINSLLGTGVTFRPDTSYSGDAATSLTVTDTTNTTSTGSGAVALKVQPRASDATFAVAVPQSGQVLASADGFVFPPGFVAVGLWPDADGTETVTVTFALSAQNAAGFTLSAGGVPITPSGAGVWAVTGTSQAALASLLDSLELTPPAGFSGFASLSIAATILDKVTFADGTTAMDGHSLGSGGVSLRFFVGGSVTTPPAFALQGGTIDLGGRYVASDPDELEGDVHTLVLSVPGGTLNFDPAAVPDNLDIASDVGPNGTTILLTGDLDDINEFLATPGSLTYTAASPTFGGVVPLTVTLINSPGDESSGPPQIAPGVFTGVAVLAFVPITDHSYPSAGDAVTQQDTPVALFIAVTAVPDTDGSESEVIVLNGLPDGTTLNHGTDLGGGQWALAVSDLAGLILTPPAGASGVFTFGVSALVTNAAPDLGFTDTVIDSTTFTLTVIPAPAPTSGDDPTAPTTLQLDGEDDTAGEDAVAEDDSPTVANRSDTDTDHDTDDEGSEQKAHAANASVSVNGYGSGTSTDMASASESSVSNSSPTQGSLFAQVEASLPIYATGDKHPLPPVLPLDQTLPVAGFSDSGGDSFALIDKLYRDAAAERFSVNQTDATPVLAQSDAATVVATASAPAAAVPAVAAVTPKDAGEGSPPAADAQESNWREWVGGVALAGAIGVGAWLARGSVSRAFHRLVRTLHRRPTGRIA